MPIIDVIPDEFPPDHWYVRACVHLSQVAQLLQRLCEHVCR